MPNPNPKTAHLRSGRTDTDVYPELAEKPISVNLPVAVDSAVRALPDRSAWLRRVITEAAKDEGLVNG